MFNTQTLKKLEIPLALLVICGFAFLPYLTQLGFYWDDWPLILITETNVPYAEFFQYNRPFSFWVYDLFGPVLGVNPTGWHIAAFVLWWLNAIGMWLTVRFAWPNREREAFAISALFAVHPAFFQQSTAVAFSQHFTTYLLFFISFVSMLAAMRYEKHARWLYVISILTAIGHMFTMEYFWGLEFIRPFFIWIVLASQKPKSKPVLQTLKVWSPYLLIILGVLVWRVFFFTGVEDPNELGLLASIRADPLSTLIKWGESVTRDYLNLFVTSWSKTVAPTLVDFGSPSLLFSWALVVAASISILFFVNKKYAKTSNPTPKNWNRTAFVIGLIAVFLSLLPGWAVEREISVGFYSNRLALPALFGTSITLVAGTRFLTGDRRSYFVLISLLIGLAIGFHVRTRNNYRWDWTYQTRFFWQMSWRAPSIAENTAIVSDGALFTYVGQYPTAAAINTFYSTNQRETNQPYWFVELDRNYLYDLGPLFDGAPIKENIRQLTFSGAGSSVILISDDVENHCLWVLDDRDALTPQLPTLTKQALPVSDLSLIGGDASPRSDVYERILGEEPPPNWCTYFQRAELARQMEKWEEGMALLAQIEEKGHSPNHAIEWRPFIEAAAYTENWATAQELTERAFQKDDRVARKFCALWESFDPSTFASEARIEAAAAVRSEMMCDRFKNPE